MLPNSNGSLPPPSNFIEPWKAIPNSSQEAALDTRAQITLFTGSRGPGKTDAQLMRFRRRVGTGYGAFWRGIIVDREYKNLDDLINKSKRWFTKYDDGATFLASNSALKWIWPTGEELLFRALKSEKDYWDYHGQEFPFIGWNELCKYPTSECFDMMKSCNRSSFTEKDWPRAKDGTPIPLPPIPLEIFATTNSYGPGFNWVKREFITPAPYGIPQRTTIDVFNPRTQKVEPVERTKIAIFGSYRENIYLDPIYVAGLESEKDPNRRKSWLQGSWDIVAGGALDDVWSETRDVLPRFAVPSTWRVDRAMDWGSSHPAFVGWFAEANGDEATLPDGSKFCPPPGTLVLFDELYVTQDIGTNKGLKWSAGKLADEVIQKEIALMDEGWITEQPYPGPADNQIRDVRESDVDTIEKKMADKGIRWTDSDKSPGARKNGLQLIRDRLAANELREGPGLYFMRNCRAAISTVPVLPRDEKKLDDVDTDAEDHPYDAIRYRVLASSNRVAKRISVGFAR